MERSVNCGKGSGFIPENGTCPPRQWACSLNTGGTTSRLVQREAVGVHVFVLVAGPRIGPRQTIGSRRIHRDTLVVAVLVAVRTGFGFIRLGRGDAGVLAPVHAIGGQGDETVRLLRGRITP